MQIDEHVGELPAIERVASDIHTIRNVALFFFWVTVGLGLFYALSQTR